jgi:hypothetical protein
MKDKKPGVLPSMSLNITVGALIALAVVILAVLFVLAPAHKEKIEFFSTLVAGGAGLYVAYYIGITLRTRIQRDKQHRSFEFLQQLNQIDTARIRIFVTRRLTSKELSAADVHKMIIENEEIHSQVISLPGLCEDISIGIQSGYAEEKQLYQSLCFLVPYVARTLQPFIEEERRIHNDDRLYEELDRLANSWKAKRALSNGAPL